MTRATVLIGGPAHGQTVTITGRAEEWISTAVFVPPNDWTAPVLDAAPARIDQHLYRPMKAHILGRNLLLYRHDRTDPESRQVVYALLSYDGQAVYAEGWGRDRPAPTGPGGLLFLPVKPTGRARFREVDDVAASVVAWTADERPAATTRTFILHDRWCRVAVPSPPTRVRDWFDTAAAHALLTPDALATWKAADD